jgi:uncharacterized membrane protein YphA (DoxX/SURF4 family)
MNTALLIARLAIGLGFAAHGAQKLFGWFGGYGLKNTGEFMEKLGWPAVRAHRSCEEWLLQRQEWLELNMVYG